MEGDVMDILEVYGGEPLFGEVMIQGSKNAVLPILTGALLISGETVIHNCPRILDVDYVVSILRSLGCRAEWKGKALILNTEHVSSSVIPLFEAQKMRSSIIFMGAMLGRCHEVSLPFPGGCVIGNRPIDFHLHAFQKMNVTIREDNGMYHASTDRLTGNRIHLPFPSVGATENIILAAVLAEGITTIRGCACEPEIVTLCEFLSGAGADISGAGSSCITIHGVSVLHNTQIRIPADRIVAGTYAFAVAATRGCAILQQAPLSQMDVVLRVLQQTGCNMERLEDGLLVDATRAGKRISPLTTGVYPEYPTDLQSPLMAYLCMAEGVSCIKETIFEDRFRIASELIRMGAVIEIHDKEAHIYGRKKLTATTVRAYELRGCAALVIAGLCASGKTVIIGKHYVERGYENLCGDLSKLGAKIMG